MKPLQALGIALVIGLGALAACFTPPALTGPYRCSRDGGGCSDLGLTCVEGLCCDPNGEPACERPAPDAGPDAGPPDAGPDGGPPDAGPCVVPQPPDCNVSGKSGLCAAGTYSCDTGSLRCQQTVFPALETCDGRDEDCNGQVDNYPGCGGPPDFTAPSPDSGFVIGAQKTLASASATPMRCLKDYTDNTTEPYDGTHWWGRGATTHLVYAEAADGGSWDLSAPGHVLSLTFSGLLTNPNASNPFNWAQPLVMLCSPNGGWRRYRPYSPSVMTVSGNAFSVATGVGIENGGTEWRVDSNGTGTTFNMRAVQRVEVLLDLWPPSSGEPSFDAGFMSFGFFRP